MYVCMYVCVCVCSEADDSSKDDDDNDDDDDDEDDDLGDDPLNLFAAPVENDTVEAQEARRIILPVVKKLHAYLPSPETHMPYFKRMLKVSGGGGGQHVSLVYPTLCVCLCVENEHD